jgi:hypothetical protein
VDIVATTPSFDVAAPIIAASGIGSCFGTRSAYFRVASAVPPYASDTINVSSSMM